MEQRLQCDRYLCDQAEKVEVNMSYVDSAEKPPVFEKRAVKRLVKNASREKQIDPGAIFIV